MANQQGFRRPINTDTPTDGGRLVFDLPRNYFAQTYQLIISGTVNITTAFTSLRQNALYNWARRIDILSNGRTVLENVTGPNIAFNPFIDKFAPSDVGLSLAPAVTVGANTFRFVVNLDRSMWDGVRPKDSMLHTASLDQLQLSIQFGTFATDVFTGAGVIGSITNARCELQVDELQEFPDPKSGKIATPRMLLKRQTLTYAVPATQANFQIKIPTGNVLRGVLLRATSNGEPTDAVINAVLMERGVDTRFNRSGLGIKADMARMYPYAPPVGYYWVDFMRLGPSEKAKMANGWFLKGQSDAIARLDVNAVGTTAIDATFYEYMPIEARG
jgi:hypothetical protein